jgi:hypothetical protein
MRKIQILMLALAAVLALSAVTTSLASAATKFELLCVFDEGSTITPKYETEAACLAEKPIDEAGNWHLGFEWLVNGNAVPATGATVDITTTNLVLEDMQAGPLKQATSILCEGTGLGLLLPGGLDEQDSMALEKCVRVTDGACETLDSAKFTNLPWLTELLPFGTEENEAKDMLYAGTGGNPGWAIECETALGKQTDTCTTADGQTLMSQEGEELNAEFPEKIENLEAAECAQAVPKAEAGLVFGLVLLMALESGALVPLTLS